MTRVKLCLYPNRCGDTKMENNDIVWHYTEVKKEKNVKCLSQPSVDTKVEAGNVCVYYSKWEMINTSIHHTAQLNAILVTVKNKDQQRAEKVRNYRVKQKKHPYQNEHKQY